MLDARAAFKFGFMARCIEDGLTPSQMVDAAEKVAGVLGSALDKTVDLGKWVGNQALGYGIPIAMFGPPAAGALAGYGLARATDIDDTDVSEIKDREVAEEYQRQAARLRRQQLARSYQDAVRRTGRVFP